MFEAIFLGIIQGLTEFIPISSSGHLLVLPDFFGWEENSTTFDIVLHGGSLLALLIHYKKTLLNIVLKNQKFALNIGIATLPALIIGFLFKDQIDEHLKSITLTAVMLILVGIIFILADTKNKKNSRKSEIRELPLKTIFIVGLLQPLAFIRGTSRSGITIIGGLTKDLTLKQAANLSFLLGIPVIGAAFAYSIFEILFKTQESGAEDISFLIFGFLSAFIASLISIKFMLKFINTIGLKWFGVYRIALAIIIIITQII